MKAEELRNDMELTELGDDMEPEELRDDRELTELGNDMEPEELGKGATVQG